MVLIIKYGFKYFLSYFLVSFSLLCTLQNSYPTLSTEQIILCISLNSSCHLTSILIVMILHISFFQLINSRFIIYFTNNSSLLLVRYGNINKYYFSIYAATLLLSILYGLILSFTAQISSIITHNNSFCFTALKISSLFLVILSSFKISVWQYVLFILFDEVKTFFLILVLSVILSNWNLNELIISFGNTHNSFFPLYIIFSFMVYSLILNLSIKKTRYYNAYKNQ